MNKILPLLIATASLAACQTNGGPLVFVVTHTVGVDIQATSTTSATPGLTVGYKSVDLAVVPTQTSTDGGAQLKGCYAVGQSQAAPGLCGAGSVATAASPAVQPGSTPPPSPPPKASWRDMDGRLIPAVVAIPLGDLPPPGSGGGGGGGGGSGAGGSDGAGAAPLMTGELKTKAVPVVGANGGNSFSESVADSYSVYASFGTKTSAGSSGTGVDVGEVFATGDAAVQLAEGVNYHAQYKGQAAVYQAQSGHPTCIEQVTAAKSAGVDASKLPDCSASSAAPPAAAAPAAAAPAAPPAAAPVNPAEAPKAK